MPSRQASACTPPLPLLCTKTDLLSSGTAMAGNWQSDSRKDEEVTYIASSESGLAANRSGPKGRAFLKVIGDALKPLSLDDCTGLFQGCSRIAAP